MNWTTDYITITITEIKTELKISQTALTQGQDRKNRGVMHSVLGMWR
jgi:hypothetical protein